MRTVRLGRTNVDVSAISLGTWGHGGPNVNEGASVGWTGSGAGISCRNLAILSAMWPNGVV